VTLRTTAMTLAVLMMGVAVKQEHTPHVARHRHLLASGGGASSLMRRRRLRRLLASLQGRLGSLFFFFSASSVEGRRPRSPRVGGDGRSRRVSHRGAPLRLWNPLRAAFQERWGSADAAALARLGPSRSTGRNPPRRGCGAGHHIVRDRAQGSMGGRGGVGVGAVGSVVVVVVVNPGGAPRGLDAR